MEMVDGTREELYWGKVPEKVRRQAVEKALSNTATDTDLGSEHLAVDKAEQRSSGRKRKRRN